VKKLQNTLQLTIQNKNWYNAVKCSLVSLGPFKEFCCGRCSAVLRKRRKQSV